MEKLGTTQIIGKDRSLAMTMMWSVIITVSIATLYALITAFTPELSFTQGSWFGYRAANSLRALAVVTPMAGVGVSLGALYLGGMTGAMLTGTYWLTPIVNIIAGYGVYKFANKGATSGYMYHVKNIALLVVYAIIVAFFVRMNHAITKFPILFAPEAQAFLWGGMIAKMISSIIGVMVGYPLIFAWNSAKAHFQK